MSTKAFEVNEEEFKKLSPAEQEELKGMLAQLMPHLEANPLITYIPHPKQKDFHAAKTKYKAFFGGNRSGKTIGSITDDLIQALDPEFIPPHLLPYKKWGPESSGWPFKGRIVTPDFTRTLGYVTEAIRKMVPTVALLGGSWEKGYDKQNRVVKLGNGSQIEFMTAEQDVDKFGGAALHRVHFDEEPPGEKGFQIFKECGARLIDYGGDLTFSMTPLLGLSWVHEVVYERRNEDGVTVVTVDMDDNPHLDEKAKREYLENLSQEERDARKSGRFIHFGGTFFPEFGDDHIVAAPKPKDLEGQDIVVGIDPGLNRPGITWTAFDNENSALVFDELIPAQMTPEAQSVLIKERNKLWGIDPAYVIDPSARNRATVNAEQLEAEYARAGIYCAPGQNDRASGILELKRRLQKGELVVSRDCRLLIWEFPRYRKAPDAPNEFDAVKHNDDLLDSLRYALMSRAWHLPNQDGPEAVFDQSFQ